MLIDTHAHLDQEEFDADRAEMIARAHAAGVEAIVAIGTTGDSSTAVVRIAHEYPGVFAAVGIQPNYCAQVTPRDWDQVVQLASEPRVVAIGETGLDRYQNFAPFDLQQEYFDRHLRLSQERGLPFVVHTRESDADVLAMLREAATRGPLSGVMHSSSGRPPWLLNSMTPRATGFASSGFASCGANSAAARTCRAGSEPSGSLRGGDEGHGPRRSPAASAPSNTTLVAPTPRSVRDRRRAGAFSGRTSWPARLVASKAAATSPADWKRCFGSDCIIL
jgi:Tat protein secretion system quality control protein TatD with DNase activity